MKRTLTLLLTALLVSGAAIGCKKKSEDPAASETQSTQEGQAAQEASFHGVWYMDALASLPADMPEEERQMAAMLGSMVQMTLTFNADNTAQMHVSMMGQEETAQLTYTVDSVDGHQTTVTLTYTSEPGGEPIPPGEETMRMRLDTSEAANGTLRVTDIGDETEGSEASEVAVFVRTRPEAPEGGADALQQLLLQGMGGEVPPAPEGSEAPAPEGSEAP